MSDHDEKGPKSVEELYVRMKNKGVPNEDIDAFKQHVLDQQYDLRSIHEDVEDREQSLFVDFFEQNCSLKAQLFDIVVAILNDQDLKAVAEPEQKQEPPPKPEPVVQVQVIGISGATRSGKSTLTHCLQQAFGAENCAVVHQDNYFDIMKICSALQGNWDHPDAINHDQFYHTVSTQIKRCRETLENDRFYIILEGFMLYYDKRIVQCIDHFIWIEISRKICYERRMSTKRETVSYFNRCIWPNYVQYKATVFGEDDDSEAPQENCQRGIKEKLIILDGTVAPAQCVQTALQRIGCHDEIASDAE